MAAAQRAGARQESGPVGGRPVAPRPSARRDAVATAVEASEDPDAPALSVTEFYDQVKSALSNAFPTDIWVMGEIRDVRERKGHHYIELADEPGGERDRSGGAQLEVCCWARDWPPVHQQLTEAGVSLEAGRVVRVRGRVSVWEGGSKIRFTLTELDIASLIGGIAAARRKLLLALEAEGLLEANRKLALSPVPLRIGLVTSPGSEAHRDFVGQLERSGFAFSVNLEPTLVQGTEAPGQIAAALTRLANSPIDLAVLVRGGGSRRDLAAFDSEPVARAISTAPFPVWTGIGHTGDRSVADEVAHLALITPTKCGEAVVGRVREYLDGIETRARQLTKLAGAQLDEVMHGLRSAATTLGRISNNELDWKAGDLRTAKLALARGVTARLDRSAREREKLSIALETATRRLLSTDEKEMARRRQVLRAYDPARQLERGWTLTCDEEGRIVRSVEGIEAGKRLRTRFADGDATSVVESRRLRDGAGHAEERS